MTPCVIEHVRPYRYQMNRRDTLPDLTTLREDLFPCGLIRRLASMAYDGLLLVALWMIAAALVIIPTGREIEPGSAIFQLYLLAVAWVYLAVCWRLGGQTLGMKAWRIHLVGNRRPISWGTTLVRFVVALASLLCFGLGIFWAIFHPRSATWHDLASNTFLMVEPKGGVKDAEA